MDEEFEEVRVFFSKQKLKRLSSLCKEFFFPTSDFLDQNFRNYEEAERFIYAEEKSEENYFQKRRRGRYYYYACKFCTARISLLEEEEGVRIVSFRNAHRHEPLKNKKIEEQWII